jgi:hypothetical protein
MQRTFADFTLLFYSCRNIVGLAIGYSKNIVVDMGFCLQVRDDKNKTDTIAFAAYYVAPLSVVLLALILSTPLSWFAATSHYSISSRHAVT